MKWDEYRHIAHERGALALELYVVESTPSAGEDAVKENLPDHLAYQRDLELAGPLSDPTGEIMVGAGLIVYRASSQLVAETLASQDPMHQSGARSFTLRKWLVNEGSLSINVGLSTGSATLS